MVESALEDGRVDSNNSAKAMTVEGSISDWEHWTDMGFADSGEYIVDGALQTVLIDRKNNIGHYEDPDLWMHHKIDSPNFNQ